ncbi:MAG TPA: hypothetical protein VFK02_32840 [Kofleriaceae bacterium]|nr:hypothetical protein [Kofleriaceae bacterium]
MMVLPFDDLAAVYSQDWIALLEWSFTVPPAATIRENRRLSAAASR